MLMAARFVLRRKDLAATSSKPVRQKTNRYLYQARTPVKAPSTPTTMVITMRTMGLTLWLSAQ